MRLFALLLLAALFVLRYDFWWWNDASLMAGLPLGLSYHVAFCFAASAVLALVVRYAWPLRDEEDGES